MKPVCYRTGWRPLQRAATKRQAERDATVTASCLARRVTYGRLQERHFTHDWLQERAGQHSLSLCYAASSNEVHVAFVGLDEVKYIRKVIS